MNCPACGYAESKVVDSRPVNDGASIRRRRECLQCQKRFTTFEIMESVQIFVVKKNGEKQLFDKSKLLVGVLKATQKRPVNAEEIVNQIEQACEKEPEKMEEILKSAAEFDVKRKKKGISLYSFKKKSNPVLNAVGKGFAAIIGLPYFLFSAVASLPMWIANEIIRAKV